jgi:hypothetical protein
VEIILSSGVSANSRIYQKEKKKLFNCLIVSCFCKLKAIKQLGNLAIENFDSIPWFADKKFFLNRATFIFFS